MKQSLYAAARALCRHLPVTGAILAENDALHLALKASAGLQCALRADAGRHRQTAAALPPDLDIIVPVCNAARWLDVIADAYDALHITPLYIVDERSTDASLALLRRRGARIVQTRSAEPRVESLLLPVLPSLGAAWVLRCDDDELPSAGLLDWVRANLGRQREPVIGLPRHWVAETATGLQRSRAIPGQGYFGADYQYRLFRPADVQPVPHLHSPGFLLEAHAHAPREAALYHFDWLLRDRATRAAKVAAYTAQHAVSGAKMAPYYLPEDQPDGYFDMETLTDPALTELCARLLATR